MTEYFDLTQSQMRIWEIEQFFQGTPINNIGGTMLLKEEGDFKLREESVFQFIESNDSFRFHFKTIDGKPVQYLSDFKRRPIPVVDFTGKTKADQDGWLSRKMKTPFQLTDSDLFTFYLVKSWDGEEGYFCVMHHIIGDAWTIALMGTQLMENYQRLREGISAAPEKRPSYLDYIETEKEYLNSSKYTADREYWLAKFKDRPEPVAIKTREKDYYSPTANRKTYIVDGEQAESIRRFCAEKTTSPAVVFEAAVCVYIGKFLGGWDVPLGSLILNRSGAKEKAMTGMFISTVPLKIITDKNGTFPDLCSQIGKEHMEAFRHQKYPYNILLSEIRKAHKISASLYDFSVSYQNSKIINHDLSFRTTWYSNGNLDDSLCLHIDDRDGAGVFVLHFDYLTDLFTEKEIDDLYRRIMLFIAQGIGDGNGKIRDMELTDEKERELILQQYNDTAVEFPKDKTVCELFEEQVRKAPDKIALRFEDKAMSYGELNRKVDRLAELLRAKGARPNKIVGMMLDRSLEMIVGVLGVWKAGAAYLPIDTSYPPERIEYLLSDSRVDTLLIQSRHKDKINFTGELIEIDDPEIYEGNDDDKKTGSGSGLKYAGSGSDLSAGNRYDPDSLAYVIYTSGSTGNPKGAMVTFGSLVNAAFAWRKDYELDQFDVRLLQIASFSFDVFVGDFCRSLLSGGEMVICPGKDQYNPRNLYALIRQYKINIMESTPALIIPLMEHVHKNRLYIDSLRLLIIGSDVCPLKNFREIVGRFGSQMRVLNSYGATEATVDTSYYEEAIDRIPTDGNTPIGKPMPNMKLLIVNEQLRLLPPGVFGELCIGGAGVSKGYINQPELTAEKFVANPYDSREFLYRTGDLARFMDDGNVEFMGRIDNQVKIRGLRIELGEIETRLLKHKFIEDAVVVAKSSEGGKKYLCGYFVSSTDLKLSDLRAYLLQSLPDYMVPSFFIRLGKIPLTPNGKVDRNRLPDPDRSVSRHLKYEAPRNEMERKLAEICCEILELEKLGIDDNLFEMGADSLSVIQIQIKVYAFDWNLTTQDFYRFPTIRQLSGWLNRLSGEQISATADGIGKVPELKINSKKESGAGDGTSGAGTGTSGAAEIRTVLLTGATGYLGIHILHQLLNAHACDIYCLVRGRNQDEAKGRLLHLLHDYFPKQDIARAGNRIFAVTGDIVRGRFGLDDQAYKELGKLTDAVIHSAANVKHYGNYTDFLKPNVIGTQRMIDFAEEFQLPLNHISTVSVSGDYLTEDPEMRRRFTEKDFYIGQNYMDNLYVRSKFEAENLILKAMDRGLEATIYRMGNLTGRYRDGMFQKNIGENAFYNRLKSIIDLKAVPKYLLSQEIEFTPVDYAGRIVAELALKRESIGRVFHLYNDKKMKIKELIEILNALSFGIEVLDNRKFSRFLKEISQNDARQNSLAGIINDLNGNDAMNYRFPVEPDSKITRACLKEYGLGWPEIDSEYITKIISHMQRAGFISKRSVAV